MGLSMKAFEEIEPGDLVEMTLVSLAAFNTIKRGLPTFDVYELKPGVYRGLAVHKDLMAYGIETAGEDPGAGFLYGYEVHILVDDMIILVKERYLQAGVKLRIIHKGCHADQTE
jgi:hypothetical protein